MIAASGLPVIEVSYEQLESRWDSTLSKIQTFLGVEVETLTSGVVSSQIYRVAQRVGVAQC
jgi:hypothetical protein